MSAGTGEYVDLGSHPNECMGNLEKCEHGLTVTFYVKPNRLIDDGYFLSTGMYSLYQKDDKTHAKYVVISNLETWL